MASTYRNLIRTKIMEALQGIDTLSGYNHTVKLVGSRLVDPAQLNELQVPALFVSRVESLGERIYRPGRMIDEQVVYRIIGIIKKSPYADDIEKDLDLLLDDVEFALEKAAETWKTPNGDPLVHNWGFFSPPIIWQEFISGIIVVIFGWDFYTFIRYHAKTGRT